MTPRSKEREKSEDNLKAKSPSLLTLLAPSILSICLSIICLCGLTWAWFADGWRFLMQKYNRSEACRKQEV